MSGQILAAAVDYTGRAVVLDRSGWHHILEMHPELASHRNALLVACRHPDAHVPDSSRPDRERFFGRDLGPSAWLLVVVDFKYTPGRITTAFAVRRLPRGVVPRP